MDFLFHSEEEIPEQFYSEKTGKAFTHCSVCDAPLGNSLYAIEKAFQKYPGTTEDFVVFEYAICGECKNDMIKDISKESMYRIQEYAMSMEMPEIEVGENGKPDIFYYLSNCIASGKPISELNEYHLMGVFRNGKLLQIPIVYGESVIEEYSELLSEKTKGFFEDFFDKITDLPPTLALILKSDEKPAKRKSPVLF